MEKYTNMGYEELVSLVQNNNDTLALDYLINYRCKNLIKKKTRGYFIFGADKEDVIQEGMVGLYKAIRDYNPQKEASFVSFAELCINRQIISAIKAAGRQKHIPLNTSISIDKPLTGEDEDYTYLDFLSKTGGNPEDEVIGRENLKILEREILNTLSKMEQQVLGYYLRVRRYTQFARLMEKDEKSIDNALQRIKKKVSLILKKRVSEQ
ncbi:MAG: RNA polymerase sporulation sigma factor SigH [Clostridia bacterium]|nr:RNA polymerase sporulation sigma factor SigH [Clostridia bacterium]